jgi:MHS family proline/betaine transporter-like MFS transporter
MTDSPTASRPNEAPQPLIPKVADGAPSGPTQRRRVILAGFIGSAVEFYDFGVYGYLATTIALLFFPGTDPVAALLSTLAVFAIAFLVRPLGGILFGHFGDTHGRRRALAVSVVAMALATVLTGLLPTYGTIGVLAPALLVVMRLLQGLSAGGEVGGAAAMLAENAPNARRAAMCSLVTAGSLIGLLLASGVVALTNLLLAPEQVAAWGWRIPFLLALPTGLVGLFVRLRLEETRAFQRIDRIGEVARIPIAEVVTNSRGPLLKAFGVAAASFAGYYIAFVYLAIYLTTEGGLSKTAATWSTTATIFAAAVALPLFGLVSDRFGRRRVLALSSIAFVILPLPAFILMSAGHPGLAIAAHIVLGLCVAANMGGLWAALAELFGTRIRFSGMALGFNLAAALVGGTAPYIAQWLIGATGSPLAPAYFLIAMALVTLAAVGLLRETANTELAH